METVKEKQVKAQELRIGNYIQDKKDREVTILQVAHISEGIINYWMESVYQPIPINEEWLLKFGCKKLGPSWWETQKGLQFNFSEDNHCGLITLGSRHLNFWHVHTFQNIIALTGEELTLKDPPIKQ